LRSKDLATADASGAVETSLKLFLRANALGARKTFMPTIIPSYAWIGTGPKRTLPANENADQLKVVSAEAMAPAIVPLHTFAIR
jgi:hypothetical protein